MKLASLDFLNIALMLVTAVGAFFIPFELFLFSYAVLGPLHYLTEISWLHRKDYFLPSTSKYLWPIFSIIALAFLTLVGRKGVALELSASIIFIIFFGALVFSITKNLKKRLCAMGILLLCSLGIWLSPLTVMIIAILLPTVVHVFLFTFCFMLLGALKSRSGSGLIAAGIFLAVSLGLLVSFNYPKLAIFTHYARNAYTAFETTNMTILSFLPIKLEDARMAVYSSIFGIAIMRFLAFIYTYHYLNWFSKTQIIRWHRVTKRELSIVLFGWIIAVSIYIYDYRSGFVVLYFLSMLHVLLEFPLNQSTFINLGKLGWQKNHKLGQEIK